MEGERDIRRSQNPGLVEARTRVVAVWIVRRVKFWIDVCSGTERILLLETGCEMGEERNQGRHQEFAARAISRVLGSFPMLCNEKIFLHVFLPV